MLEADEKWVKTTNTEVQTIVMTISTCKAAAWRKNSADIYTQGAIPMAIE